MRLFLCFLYYSRYSLLFTYSLIRLIFKIPDEAVTIITRFLDSEYTLTLFAFNQIFITIIALHLYLFGLRISAHIRTLRLGKSPAENFSVSSRFLIKHFTLFTHIHTLHTSLFSHYFKLLLHKMNCFFVSLFLAFDHLIRSFFYLHYLCIVLRCRKIRLFRFYSKMTQAQRREQVRALREEAHETAVVARAHALEHIEHADEFNRTARKRFCLRFVRDL